MSKKQETTTPGAVISDLRNDFGLLSDEAKAEVMKAQIAEGEKTRRTQIEQEEQTRRNLHNTEGFHIVRGFFIIFLLCVVAGSTCVGYHKIDLEDARVRAAHPAPPPPPPPPTPVIVVQPDAGAPGR